MGRRIGGASTAVMAAALLALGGCTVGPNYVRPTVQTPDRFSDLADKAQAPLSQTSTAPPDEAQIAQWWRQFHDPMLDELIARALRDNLDIQIDYARIRQAREQVVVSGAAGLPHVSLNGTVARLNQNADSDLTSSIFSGASQAGAAGAAGGAAAGGESARPGTFSHINLFSPAFDATWEVDVFGGVRRSVEAAQATTQAMVWAKRDAEVSLTSELATDYLMLRDLQVQVAIAQAEVKSQQGIFAIISDQRQTGFVNRVNVNQQEAQVQATIAAIPQIEAQIRAQIHAIGVLLGQDPEALEPELSVASPDKPLPMPPQTLPVGLPSDLLRRRPDIQEAERQLAASTAQVGVQVANLYPRFDVVTLGAIASDTFTGAFNGGNATSIGAALIQWPLFEGGRTRGNIRAARAQQDQAYYSYKKTVLTAVENVEDALSRYAADQRRIGAVQASLNASTNSLLISRQQYEVGLATFTTVLNSEEAELNSRNMLVQDQGQLAVDLVSLYKALGGGWSADEGKDLAKPGLSAP